MSRTRPPVAVHASSFQEEAAAVLADLRQAFANLIRELDGPIARAVDLERSLRLDKKLAWQVFRLSQSAALDDAANVPVRPSVRRLLAAARSRGVNKATIEGVSDACERFEAFASMHAGDREGLISMIAGNSGGGETSEQFELKMRRTLFRANAHVWGIQARLQLRTLIYHFPAGSTGPGDNVLISGDIGLQRLRQSDPLVLVRWLQTQDVPAGDPARRPLAPVPIEHQLNLLPAFCTQPLPRMVAKPSGEYLETELVVPTGRTGAVTLYSSQRYYEGVISGPQAVYFGRMFVTTPVEAAVWEILVPAGMTDPATARFCAYGRRTHPERVYDGRTVDLLPMRAAVSYIGATQTVPPLDGSPAHAEAVNHVLERHGWRNSTFDVYRCRIQYPILHTLLCLIVDAGRQA